MALFKRVFNLACRNGKTHYNPAKSVQKLKGEESRDRVLSDEEWEAYYQKAPAWYKPIALCAYVTGMREGEILNLKWKRVNRKTGFIRLKPEDTKTSEGRPIPIDPRLDEVLAALPRSMRHPELVFTRDGKPISDIRWWHNKTCREAKIEDFWFHDFRHTCITNWRRKGVDFITIMKATGHKTLSMFHRYNAVGDDDLRALVSKTRIGSQIMVNSGK
jgi:integrase